MSAQVFIDESHRKSRYLLIATFIPINEVNSLRRKLRQAPTKPGQTFHMTKASNETRLKMCYLLTECKLNCLVIEHCDPSATQFEARMACLDTLCKQSKIQSASQMTLDFSTTEVQDCRIFEAHRSRLSSHFPIYRHSPSRHEPLLWVPDAVGWCWGRGGYWKKLIEPCVNSHIYLGK